MNQSNLFQIIAALDKKDRRAMKQWLDSVFFNSRADVRALYEHIDKWLDKNPARLIKHAAFEVVYPGRAFDETQMNHLMSWLSGQIRDYLAWKEWQADEAAVKLMGCRSMRRLGLEDAFGKAWDSTLVSLDAQPWRDEQWHQMRYQLYREKYEHQSLQRRMAEVPLEQMAFHAGTAWQLNQLRYECSVEIRRTMSSEATAPETAEPEATVLLYRHLLQALRQPSEEAAFVTARQLLEAHWMRFRDSERRDLYLLALNYCIRKINSGSRAFMREAFDLYRSGFDNRALFENGLVSRFTYKNAVTAGLALQEFEWTLAFIERYKSMLPPRERHGAYTYNLAVYYFRLPDYEQAMRLLRDSDFGDDVLTNLDARSMLLRMYFEQGYVDALESLLDSFQTYLRRQKQVGYQREHYLNLIRFVRKLIRADRRDRAWKAGIREEIEGTAALAERGWLLGQLG
jgi:tetratricopeptide (TPR) repeat protein